MMGKELPALLQLLQEQLEVLRARLVAGCSRGPFKAADGSMLIRTGGRTRRDDGDHGLP